MLSPLHAHSFLHALSFVHALSFACSFLRACSLPGGLLALLVALFLIWQPQLSSCRREQARRRRKHRRGRLANAKSTQAEVALELTPFEKAALAFERASLRASVRLSQAAIHLHGHDDWHASSSQTAAGVREGTGEACGGGVRLSCSSLAAVWEDEASDGAADDGWSLGTGTSRPKPAPDTWSECLPQCLNVAGPASTTNAAAVSSALADDGAPDRHGRAPEKHRLPAATRLPPPRLPPALLKVPGGPAGGGEAGPTAGSTESECQSSTRASLGSRLPDARRLPAPNGMPS